MGITVFANDDGFFHKGSGGSGKAFPDVCLSPPPPPAGPVPIPYPNTASASDLADGSKTVKIDGEPTALEDVSYCSTSSGDEGGTQGGGVVSHKTKGTACFTFWSLDVKVEGKGVDRHQDPMLNNCGSKTPPNGLTATAQVKSDAAKDPVAESITPCCPGSGGKGGPYKRSSWIKESSTEKQKVAANTPIPPATAPSCWECGSTSPRGNFKNGKPRPAKGKRFVADHNAPLIVRHYSGGCWMSKSEKKADAEGLSGIIAHCTRCSGKQGSALGSKGEHPKYKKAHGCK